MPIITKAKVKALLQITNSKYDTLIDELIPIVQGVIVDECNNYFKDSNVYLKTDTISFADTDPDTILDSLSGFVDAKFAANMEIVVEGSDHNNGMYTAETVVAGTITLIAADELVTEAVGNEVTITKVEWPRGLWSTTAKMIGYDMASTTDFKNIGISAESYGDYSRSYAIAGETGEYPKKIIGGLIRYKKVRYK